MIPVSRPNISDLEVDAVQQVLRRGWVTQGEKVREFESMLSNLLRVPYVFACSSGTAALHLALLAVGVSEGDEVLVPDLTYVATANAVRYVGATPVLVDVSPDTWLINLEEAEKKINRRTRAILPVHLYGVPCDLSSMAAFAAENDLLVVEDAAEALTGSWKDVACGSGGDAGTFSFYANKLITTGEGGAVVCWEQPVAERIKSLRGQAMHPERRFYHTEVGYNYRMTDLHAALGVSQLMKLPGLIRDRWDVYRDYGSALSKYLDSAGSCPSAVIWADRQTVPWLYTLDVGRRRDRLARALWGREVETRPTFIPLHRLPMYRAEENDFPVASMLGDCGLSLPTYPGVNTSAVIDRFECAMRTL